MFHRTSCTQRVVHKGLWIAVDMWRTPGSDTHVGVVVANYGTGARKKRKTETADPVEVGLATPYVANRRPDVPTSKYLVRGSAGHHDESSSGLRLYTPWR